MRVFAFALLLVGCSVASGGEQGVAQSSAAGEASSSGTGGESSAGGSAGGALGITRACEPGRSEACACSDGATGAQTCSADGSTWGSCACTTGQGGVPGAAGMVSMAGAASIAGSSGGLGGAATGGSGGSTGGSGGINSSTCVAPNVPPDAQWRVYTVGPGDCLDGVGTYVAPTQYGLCAELLPGGACRCGGIVEIRVDPAGTAQTFAIWSDGTDVTLTYAHPGRYDVHCQNRSVEYIVAN